MTETSRQSLERVRARRAGAYFGANMAASQGDVIRKAYLALLVEYLGRSTEFPEINVLEVGSWAGASTVAWARTLKDLGLAGRVLCVDFWRPYFDLRINQGDVYQRMTEAAKDGSIFELFLDNLRACRVDDIVDYIVGDSKTVLPSLEHGSFQIAFLDASHSYADILIDIQNAMPLVAEGGILCGDDFELAREQLDPEAHRVALHQGVDYARDPRTAIDYHPGVTQALSEVFGSVSSWNGVWGMRKTRGGWQEIDLSGLTPHIPAHLATVALDSSLPKLLESYKGYNLVAWREQFIAVHQSLGEVDVTQGAAALLRSYSADDIIVAHSIEEAHARVDAIVIGRTIQAVQERLEALSAEIAAIRPSIETPLLIENYRGMSLIASGRQVFGIQQRLGEIDVRIGAEALIAQHGPENVIVGDTAPEVRARIDTVELTRRLDALIAEFSSTPQRTTCDIGQLQRDTDLLRHRDDDLASAIRQLRWEPLEPLLVESYNDVNIVAYGGLVLGIRQKLGEVDVRIGAAALIERYGPENVLVAGSPDGVRARIDIMELDRKLQDMHASRLRWLLGLSQLSGTNKSSA